MACMVIACVVVVGATLLLRGLNAVKSCACGSSFDTADSAGKAQAHACH
jgi:hypothetical protein